MRIVIPFSVLKKLYDSPQDREIMGIVHTNDQINYDRVLISHDEENKSAKNECRIENIVIGTVSFHTHPKICYDIYKTEIGWPSLDDFNSFLREDRMKVLIVAAVEGVYIIGKKEKITSAVVKEINLQYKTKISKKNISIPEYIKHMNEICNNCAVVILFTKDKINKESPSAKIKMEVF